MNSISKKQQAYEYLRSKIITGTFGPGYRIVIDQVASDLELSIIPVREAIRQLESDGLIQYKPYSGAIVSNINKKEYVETLSILAVLEGYATAQSAKLISEEDIALLTEINGQMSDVLYNFEFEQFGELNRKFHTVIYESCDNDNLKKQINNLWERMGIVRRSGFTFMPQRARQSIAEHSQIIQMLSEQAPPDVIEPFVRQHKLNTVNAFKSNETEQKKI